MGDHRATIKLAMHIHGKQYETEMWINYWPENDGCDRRIVECFAHWWADAKARYDQAMWEAQRQRDAETDRKERAELARLRAKYDPPT